MAMKNYPALSDFKPPLGQQMSGLKKNLSFRCLKNYFLAAILIFIATRVHYQIGLATRVGHEPLLWTSHYLPWPSFDHFTTVV